MTEIYEQTHLEINEKVQLKDGRIIQRHSQPLFLNGVYSGRLWMFEQNECNRLKSNRSNALYSMGCF